MSMKLNIYEAGALFLSAQTIVVIAAYINWLAFLLIHLFIEEEKKHAAARNVGHIIS